MRIIADTNVLVRIAVRDDIRQADLAIEAFRNADEVAIPTLALCEFVWVLEQRYRRPRGEIARTIRELLGDPKVSFDQSLVQAGLEIYDAGGGFADGIIAFEGRRLGGDVLVTFDRDAARLVSAIGGKTRLLPSV